MSMGGGNGKCIDIDLNACGLRIYLTRAMSVDALVSAGDRGVSWESYERGTMENS